MVGRLEDLNVKFQLEDGSQPNSSVGEDDYGFCFHSALIWIRSVSHSDVRYCSEGHELSLRMTFDHRPSISRFYDDSIYN